MKRSIPVLLLSMVLLVSLTSCGGKTFKLDEDSNGESIEITKGATLSISLQGNPTTGYNWELAEVDQSILKPAGEVDYKSGSPLIGSGGVYTFKFEAVETGSTNLKLIYYRSFEEDTPPVNTFELTVLVK
jgi:inhibitor of cysteine peptidase